MDKSYEEKKRGRIAKYECKDRLDEMKINESLNLLNPDKDSIILDIGSGTGVFAFEISKKVNKVFSLEKQEMMLDIQRDKKAEGEGENVEIIEEDIEGKSFNFEDNFLNGIILITLVHEINDKDKFINEMHRSLKDRGRVLVIDFKKDEEKLDMGPPLEERITDKEMENLFKDRGFKTVEYTEDMGYYYRYVFEKN